MIYLASIVLVHKRALFRVGVRRYTTLTSFTCIQVSSINASPVLKGETQSGIAYEWTVEVDVERGDGTGYGSLFL
jgi:hypothetical protein